MADHAVEGVEHLVAEQPGQAEQQVPRHRRDHSVGEVLGAALDGAPGDAVAVEVLGVAPDHVAHRLAPAGEPLVLEGGRHRPDVDKQAALGDQRRHHRQLGEPAERYSPDRPVDRPTQGGGEPDQGEGREHAAKTPRGVAAVAAVELGVAPADDPAHQRHGMGDHPVEHRRIADIGVERERQKQQEISAGPGGERAVVEHGASMESTASFVNSIGGNCHARHAARHNQFSSGVPSHG